MPSPFRGVDPYLEETWRDVHASLILYLRDAIQDDRPPALIARVEQRVILELPDGWTGPNLFPDARVTSVSSDPSPAMQGTGVVAVEPIVCEAEAEPITEGFVEVIDPESGNKVVTTIEILSPA